MNLNVSLDVSDVSRMLLTLRRDQIPFALSQSINKTALQAQGRQRTHIRAVFMIRSTLFADRATKISPFAKKGSPTAVIKIEPPGGRARADIFSKFEDGGVKRPKGSRLAIPADARRGKRGTVVKSARPKSFNFKVHGKTGSTEVLVGDKRTFMVRRADGSGGIYQRTGRRGKNSRRMASSVATRSLRDMNVRTLYRFTRQANIDSRLQLEENVKGIVRANFPANFDEAFARAVAAGRTQSIGRMGGVDVIKASKAARRIARTDVGR